MAITTISDLTAALKTGARSNLFRVTISSGALEGQEGSFSYLCKGAQLPSSTLGLIEVPFMAGRRYKIAGDRTFPEWTTTVINDSNQKIRQAIENLQKKYSTTDYESSSAKEVTGAEASDFSVITVEQYDLSGNVVYTYTLNNCWPTDISTIDLSYDSTDTLEEFTVSWAYDYFTFE